jgi:hypothetical protein
LRKAVEGDRFEVDGWTFADLTQFGPSAQDWYIRERLLQRVHELTLPVGQPQSEDRWAPNYAPPMFDPEQENVRIVSA